MAAPPSATPLRTMITQLPSGLRVASYDTPSHFAAVGVFVDAGSRYETPESRGVSHFIDRLAFKSTRTSSELDNAATITSLGGNVFCTSTRESILYQAAVFHANLETTMSLLASTTLQPAITDTEIDLARRNIAYELEDLQSKPEVFATELLHAAAYGDEGLGNSLMCDAARLDVINRDTIFDYRRMFYRPERMVVAGSGIVHEQLVALTQATFGPILSGYTPQAPLPIAPARYQGGSRVVQIPPPPPTHPNPIQPLTYVQLAFPTVPFTHPDIYAMATLQLLMGGGGSFSAGGPGKGMFSRLYTNVLNRYRWMDSCLCFHHSYNDSGLFGIAATCDPRYNEHVLNVVVGELLHMGDVLSDSEITRAKNMLKSSLLMNLESQMVRLEDVGRQVQVTGKRVEADEMIANIDAVTKEHLLRVAQELTSRPLSFSAVGEHLDGLPSAHDTLERFLAGRKRSRWSFKL
ncbi:Mitochondrial-processing peptidase subunit alpha [Sorochytrium milnesiophthora]